MHVVTLEMSTTQLFVNKLVARLKPSSCLFQLHYLLLSVSATNMYDVDINCPSLDHKNISCGKHEDHGWVFVSVSYKF